MRAAPNQQQGQGKQKSATDSRKEEPEFDIGTFNFDAATTEAPEADQESRGDRKGKGGKTDRDREKREREQRRKEQELEQRMAKEKAEKNKSAPKNILLPEGISIANLGTLLGVKYEALAKKMRTLGFENTESDYVLPAETASLVVLDYGMNPIVIETEIDDLEPRPKPEDWSAFPLRPPVVTIMGHVDHGKTTLLDSLRKTSVAAGEAGGITQHIGAFSVLLPSGKRITFLDTPGHAAFSAMRARGAQVTDIVVLVVAADDGVMPQTVEAIKHSLAANVPIIVAINKCDKPGINLKKAKEGLIRYDIIPEDFGGDVPTVAVSGLTGKGLDELEETILTVSEVLDLRGDAEGPCEATIIESKLSRERGNVATVLVQRGTLRPGDVLVSGTTWCKARRLLDENGKELLEAGPSMPIEVMGWKELPAAGDLVLQAESENQAKRVVQDRIRRDEQLRSVKMIEESNERRSKEKQERADMLSGEASKPRETDDSNERELRLIIKADVHGSLEALENVINSLPSHEIQATIVSSGVGAVTDSDIAMAAAAGARIVAFNIPCERRILSQAQAERISIHQHQIIYSLVDNLKEIMADMLPPEIIKEVLGEAEVLQLFSINVRGKQTEMIAGCRITNGKLARNSTLRVLRGGETVFEGTVKTLKHHKKDITEASKGLECGLALEGFDGFQAGDTIQAIKTTERRRTID